eukprot:snap_masked-scaffold_4-processed-gene-11.42-mRNA-1 protein AED:0.07 eAED:0.17 QI:0/-1/0/1/-1/1/1/0/693
MKKVLYLDYAGAALPPEEISISVFEDKDLGNPHTSGPSSLKTKKIVDDVRKKVLRFFGTDSRTHTVVFTSGATHAMKLVGEYFVNKENSCFCFSQNAHTSLVGVRQYFRNWKCYQNVSEIQNTHEFQLIGITAESNFNGEKFDFNSFRKYSNSVVLLDAAKFCATNPLNLSKVDADFTAVSFYKIFGYPTGVGCLIIKNSSSHYISQSNSYFGGGNVSIVSPCTPLVKLAPILSTRLESGSLNFYGIAQLSPGLRFFSKIGMEQVRKHTINLIQKLHSRLSSLTHFNGRKVLKFYIPSKSLNSSILTFNLLDIEGTVIGHKEVANVATINDIQIRTGIFCNAGAAMMAFNLTNEDMEKIAEFQQMDTDSFSCWEEVDSSKIDFNKPLGAIRVSVGYCSTEDDIETFVSFIESYFVVQKFTAPSVGSSLSANPSIRQLFVYPVKSCKGFRTSSWPLSKYGLLYDRHFAIVDENDVCLDQKKYSELTQVQTEINLEKNILRLKINEQICEVPLSEDLEFLSQGFTICDMRREGIESASQQYVQANQVLSNYLGFPVRLIKTAAKSFNNRGDILMISLNSVEHLRNQLPETDACNLKATNFRANIVIDCNVHEEDIWFEEGRRLLVSGNDLSLAGHCKRCPMVNINQETGEKQTSILKKLAKYRRTRTSINFGQFLKVESLQKFAKLREGDLIKFQ